MSPRPCSALTLPDPLPSLPKQGRLARSLQKSVPPGRAHYRCSSPSCGGRAEDAHGQAAFAMFDKLAAGHDLVADADLDPVRGILVQRQHVLGLKAREVAEAVRLVADGTLLTAARRALEQGG